MILKNLKKAFIKNTRSEGFTLIELLVGSVIVAIASLAMFTGIDYIQTSSHRLRIKERAFEELKSYTELWKGKIAADDVSEGGDLSYSKVVCLDHNPPFQENECKNEATIFADINLIDTQNSNAKRKGVKTRIEWETVFGATQLIDFYVEQMVFSE